MKPLFLNQEKGFWDKPYEYEDYSGEENNESDDEDDSDEDEDEEEFEEEYDEDEDYQRNKMMMTNKTDYDRLLKQIAEEMASNDSEIEASLAEDLDIQMYVLESIIKRSKHIADFVEWYYHETGKKRELMEEYRNYQHM